MNKKLAITFGRAVLEIIEGIALISAAGLICVAIVALVVAAVFLVVSAPFAAVAFAILWPLSIFGVI